MNLEEGLAPTPSPGLWISEAFPDGQGKLYEVHTLQANHGLQDEKGRQVGAEATIHHLGKDFQSVLTEGGTLLYRLVVVPTRDSHTFGSGRSFSFHKTLEEAQVQARLKINQQALSYHKKYAS
jgi:hypothetical protein